MVSYGTRRRVWFVANVDHVTADGRYSVIFPDGDGEILERGELRPYIPCKIGEAVDVYIEEEFIPVIITLMNKDGTYNVVSSETDEMFEGVDRGAIRRSS